MSDLKKLIKKCPIIGPATLYISGNFIQSKTGKKNSTIFNFTGNIPDDPTFEITKIDKSKRLYSDRFQEVKDFFGKNMLQIILHYIRNGTPNTAYYRRQLASVFETSVLSEINLKRSYEKAAFMYVNRLMLRYHNYDIGKNALSIAKLLNIQPEELRVCDYGCGAADPSLFLALHGADITIVDLDDSKFEFCRSRFEKRNLTVKAFAAKQTESPVCAIGSDKLHFIFMAEFLEHVRNPRLFLEFALERLDDKTGVLYDSLGSVYNHSIGGDHLFETKQVMDNSDYKEYFERNLVSVNKLFSVNDFEHFYIKC